MDNSIIIALIGGFFGLVGALVAGYFAMKQIKAKGQIESKAEVIKTETMAKATEVQVATEKETKRIDQLLDTTMELIRNLQAENRQQRQEITNKDLQHADELMQIRSRMSEIEKKLQDCVVGRSQIELKFDRLKAEHAALEAQFKSTAAYVAAHHEASNNDNA